MVNFLPQTLRTFLITHPYLAIAYSGGLDSRFLCHAARLCNCDIIALHLNGPHISERESNEAKKWAEANRVPCVELFFNPLENDAIAHNDVNRCYHCKKALIGVMKDYLANNAPMGWLLCDGGNTDDETCYRPGLAAIREESVISPLALAGMGKNEIRECGRETGLDNYNQQPKACLLTRFNYGIRPDQETLERLEACETHLDRYFGGSVDFRVRLCPQTELHIHSQSGMDIKPIVRIMESYGFSGASVRFMSSLHGFFDHLFNNSE